MSLKGCDSDFILINGKNKTKKLDKCISDSQQFLTCIIAPKPKSNHASAIAVPPKRCNPIRERRLRKATKSDKVVTVNTYSQNNFLKVRTVVTRAPNPLRISEDDQEDFFLNN